MFTSNPQSRTRRADRRGNIFGGAALAATAALATPAGAATAWPPFLPPPETFDPGVAAQVERVWEDPTLSRTVEGTPARVPFDVYTRFVDAPDVTAAAARHLGLARYEVRRLDDRSYEADDHQGAQGYYRVLVHEPGRRVILSWGRHAGTVLGTIRGEAITVLRFGRRGAETTQELTAYVRIENRVAALLARGLVRIFGGVADRKLSEGFRVTAHVAEWAVSHPADFCRWLAGIPAPSADVARVADAAGRCDLAQVRQPSSSADSVARATPRPAASAAGAPSPPSSR